MDKNGYPEEHELKKIRNWPYTDSFGLMKYIKDLWYMDDWGFSEKKGTFYLSTGGWSGNEEIIEALAENIMFWNICWWSSNRGGHYIFKIPEALKGEATDGEDGV